MTQQMKVQIQALNELEISDFMDYLRRKLDKAPLVPSERKRLSELLTDIHPIWVEKKTEAKLTFFTSPRDK